LPALEFAEGVTESLDEAVAPGVVACGSLGVNSSPESLLNFTVGE
jgi:hypothetical protein